MCAAWCELWAVLAREGWGCGAPPPEHLSTTTVLSCLAPAWVVPGLQEALVASPAERKEVMSKLEFRESSNKQRSPQVFAESVLCPCSKLFFVPILVSSYPE